MKQIQWTINDPTRTVIIKRVDNGYTMTKFDQYSDSDEIYHTESVIESEENIFMDDDDLNAVERLIWELLNSLEIYGNDDQWLEIKVRNINEKDEDDE